MRPPDMGCYDWEPGETGQMALRRADGMGIDMSVRAEFLGWRESHAQFRLFPPYFWYDKNFDIDGLQHRFGGCLRLHFRDQEMSSHDASFSSAGEHLLSVGCAEEFSALDEVLS